VIRSGVAAALIALALTLMASPPAQAAADPSQPHAPAMDFVPPAPGSYELMRIQPAPEAVLLDADGRLRQLAQYTHGRVTLLTFFYTYCTDAFGCPFAYQLMTGLRAKLSAQPQMRERLRFVSISLDPTHDTPDALRLYAGGAAGAARATGKQLPWVFLTARSGRELLPLLEDFGQDVDVERDTRGRPTRTINHMLKLFLLDAEGMVREIYALDYLHPQVIANDIETLLMERPQ
jgi:protein SCO1